MKSLLSMLLLFSVSIVTFSQKNTAPNTNQGNKQNAPTAKKETTKEDKGTKEDQDTVKVKLKPGETKITPGASGVKRSIGYRFSSAIGDEDPGDGIFRYNNKNVTSVSYIFVDKNDIKGEDQTNWYETWDDTTGATGRGQIVLVELNGDDVNIFNVTDVFIEGNGYWKFPVKYVSGKLPENDSIYFYVFNRIAHRGGEGNEGDEGIEEPVVETEAPADTVQVVEVITEAPADTVQVVEVVTEAPADTVPVVEVVTEAPVVAVGEEVEVVEEPRVTETKPVEPTHSQGTQSTTVAQGPPRVTETRQPTQEIPETKVTQPVPATRPVQGTQSTTVAQGPPRVTETRQPTQEIPETKVTQPVPATRPAQGTQTTTIARTTHVSEAPVTQNYYGSSTGLSHGKCYRGMIEIGYALRVGEYGMNNFRFNFINGFNIRNTSIGLGIGIRKYYDKASRHTDWHLVSSDIQIPVFLDVRTHFSSKKVTPYLGIGIGNSTGFDSDTTNNQPEGLYFHGTGGIWFNLSERFAVFGGFAYELQKLEYANVSDEILYKKYTYSISLNIGIAF
jgi:hypothetical protein